MEKATRKRGLPIFIAVAVVIVIALLITLSPTPQPQPAEKPTPPELTVIYAEPKAMQVTVTSRGTVRPKREADLVAEVSGRVQWVADSFVNGGFFKAGELLLKLDDRDYRNMLVSREAGVAEAKRALAVERGQSRLARREWQDLGNTEGNELFLRKPQIAAAEAKLAAAIADLDQAKINLQRTEVRAPFDGLLSQTGVHTGQYVTPGKVLGRAFDISVMEVPLPLTDRQQALVDLPLHADSKQQTSATLIASVAGQHYEWPATIVRTEASFDTQSRVLYAVAEVANPYQSRADGAPPLSAGMFVEVEIAGKSFDNAVALPSGVLYQRNKVLTLDSEQRLQVSPVTVLQSGNDSEQSLVSGIANGTAVLLQRPPYVIAGMKITPQLSTDTTALAEE